MSLWKRVRALKQARRQAGQPPQAPEQVLEDALREMDAALKEALTHFAELTALERKVASERDAASAKALHYEDQARRHALTGRDDLAREALLKRAEQEQIAAQYQAQWERQHHARETVEQQILDLKRQFQEAERSRALYLVRQQANEARQKVSERLQSQEATDALRLMRDLEARDEAEAELEGRSVPRPAPAVRPAVENTDAEIARLRGVEPQAPAPPRPLPWFPDDPPAPQQSAPVTPETADTPAPREFWFDDEPALPSAPAAARPALSDVPAATLIRGANIALPAATQTLRVGFAWETLPDESPVEIDACALLLAGDLVRSADDYIFFNNRRSVCGAVEHDGKTFPGEPDNETMQVSLPDVAPTVTRIIFAVAIYDAAARRQTFAQVPAVLLRLTADDADTPLAAYLHLEADPDRAVVLGELYRYKDEWKFRALGQGFVGGLPALLGAYGVTV